MTATDLVPSADTTVAVPAEPDTTLSPDLITAAERLLGEDAKGIFAVMAGAFERMEWAEEEIAAAQARHPQQADRIWHSFSLLQPNPGLERMASEMIYRSHCREILDRVAAGEDTRPGTAAEGCCALRNTSLVAPLTSAGAGLYLRLWNTAGLPDIDDFAEARTHYEALKKRAMDEHEQFLRSKLAMPDRRLGAIDCDGRHHGNEVDCVYAPAGQLLIEV
ncbi:hypothetical protein [Amycolatopsis sp. cg9]|uniref:hypothetical protein n=1 Tax=Amycolatopsis sp. cg9 TaxID=3238801 RepID=UPI00352535CD